MTGDPVCLTAALEYLRMGWSPLALCPPNHLEQGGRHNGEPCKNPGKIPLGRWAESTLKRPNEKALKAAWRENPTANVGVCLGGVSGLIGLDIDGPEAEELAVELFGEEGLPPTLRFPSPGGGRRLLYGCGPECILGKARWDRGESHVIVMGRGAQTVMPPSQHENGKRYEWPVERLPIAPLPEHVLAKALAVKEKVPSWAHESGAAHGMNEGQKARERARRYLAACDPAISGQSGHNQTYKVAVSLVKGFDLSPEAALSLLITDYNPRCQPPWTEKELRHKVEEAAKAPDEQGFLLNQPVPKSAPPQRKTKTRGEPKTAIETNAEEKKDKEPPVYIPSVLTATDLYNRDFGEMRWAIDGLIPEGATILAGKPKMGKSWLALNIALAVASGGVALGKVSVKKGEVLYLALEDGPRRLQRRLHKLLEPANATPPPGLMLTCGWARWNEGGLPAVAKWIEQRPATRLIVIDTLARVRSRRTLGGGIYEEDYDAISTVQSLALEAGIAAVIVTHTRKSSREEFEPDDPLEEVSGSLGLTGAADAVLVLKRPRHGREGKLFITGRDVDEKTISLGWDSRYCLWTQNDTAEGPQLSEDQRRVVEIVRQAGRPMGGLEIAEAIGGGKSYEGVKKMIQRMARDGLLRKTAHGQYAIPGEEPNQETPLPFDSEK